MTRSVVLLAASALLYLLVAGAMFAFQRRLLYLPDTRPVDASAVPALRPVTLDTADGLRLRAWWAPPAAGAPVVVHFHGNGGNAGCCLRRAARWAARGWGVLLVEYRGYGGNPGSPSESGLYADGRAALDFVRAQGVPPARVVLYGVSLGTGVAVRMASERPPGVLVLELPYTSMAAVAARRYPWLPVRPLLRDRYDSLSRIAAVRAPLLVLHAGRDELIPTSMGTRLLDAAPGPKRIWLDPDAGHEDLLARGGDAVVAAFVARAIP